MIARLLTASIRPSLTLSTIMAKKSGGASYYAVAKGRRIGVFATWPECQEQVMGVSGSIYKKFKTMDEAQSYIAANRTESVYSDEEAGEGAGASSSTASGAGPSSSPSAPVADYTGPSVASAMPDAEADQESATQSTIPPASQAEEDATQSTPSLAKEPPRLAPIFNSGKNAAPGERKPSRYYAVARGYEVGVYTSWSDCKKHIEHFPGARHATFKKLKDAQAYVDGMRVDILRPEPRAGRSTQKVADAGSWRIKEPEFHKASEPTASTLPVAESLHAHRPFLGQADASSDTEEEHFGPESSMPSQSSLPSSSGTKRSFETSPRLLAATSFSSTKKTRTGGEADGLADAPIVISSDEEDDTEWIAAATAAANLASPSSTPSSSTSSALPKIISVYCDGAASKNGQAGATAGYGVWFADEGEMSKLNESKRVPGPVQSNNRAELWAAIRAIQIAPRDRPLIIHTDSKYTIQTVTSWIINWRKNNWRTASKGGEVQNRDLIRRLDKEIRDRPIKPILKYIKGHAGHHGNEMADRLAVHGARLPEVPEGTYEDPEPPPSDDESTQGKVEDPKHAQEVAVQAWVEAGFPREIAERKVKSGRV